MTKQEILFNLLGVFTYSLDTKVVSGERNKVNKYYYVTWKCKYTDYLIGNEIRQEITKEEYDCLLKELEND